MVKEISNKVNLIDSTTEEKIEKGLFLREGEITIGETVFADTKGSFLAHPIRYIKDFLDDYIFRPFY